MKSHTTKPPTFSGGIQAEAAGPGPGPGPGPDPLDQSLLRNADYLDALEHMAADIYAHTRNSLPPAPMPPPKPRPISPINQLQALQQQLQNNIVLMASNVQHLEEMERQLAASGQALWRLAAAHGVAADGVVKRRRMDASVLAQRDPLLELIRRDNEALGNL